MKIEQEVNSKVNQPLDYANLKALDVKVKNFQELSPGDIFKATVTDIQPNQVTLKLATGELTAKSLVLPDARIGDDALFAVKENKKGQILLEMIKPDGDFLKANIAREALVSANIYPGTENIKLAKALMDNNLPIDANSLQKAAFFHYSAANLPLDKIIFLMKENFSMDALNIKTLETLMENGGFAKTITDMFEGFSGLDVGIKARFLEKFIPVLELSSPEFTEAVKTEINEAAKSELNDERIQNLIEKTSRHLCVALKDKNSLLKLADYFSELHKAVSEAEKLFSLSGREEDIGNELILKRLDEIKNQLEFMDHISNYKEYLQIPLNINGQINNAELFVFKEPKKKKNLNERASVLIAMDYAFLGRVEIFIDKVDKNLSFQFRCGNKESLKLINARFTGLGEALINMGYKISGVTFKNIDESFTVLNNIEAEETKAKVNKRYSFDMRV